MSRGETIALAVGGAALVGGGLYLLMRKPVAKSSSSPGALAPSVGTGLTSLLGGLGSGLVNVFGGSKSTPTVAVINNQPLPNLQPSAGWAGQSSANTTPAVSNTIADSTAASDSESGVVGFGGWDD